MLSRRHRIQRRMMQRLVPFMEGWHRRLEATVSDRPGAIHAGPTSPERVNILLRAIQVPDMHAPPGFPQSAPQLVGSMRGIKASIEELDDNPAEPRTEIDAEGLAELEAVAKQNGALSIGYATVDRDWCSRAKQSSIPMPSC